MPFGGLVTTGILGVASAAPKIIASIKQKNQADNLKLQNTETPEEREALAMSRQAAATSRLPGLGAAQARLGMVQAGAVQNARLGAGSSADFLAAAGAADTRRMQGEQALSTQGLQYQDASKQQLRRDLTTASNRRQHDLDTYNQNKAALTQSAAQNLDNGVGTLASYGAQAVNMGINTGTIKTPFGAGGAAAFEGGVTPQLNTGLGAYGGPPAAVPNMAGRYPGIPSLGSRRYARLGYYPQ